MQKLLRLSPSAAPISGSPSLSLPILSLHTHSFLSLRFTPQTPFPMPPPTSTSLAALAASASLSSARRPVATVSSSRAYSGLCRCSLENRAPFRAWVQFKVAPSRPRSAWLHTSSFDGSVVAAAAASATEGVGDSEPGPEEKPLRMNRRQRSSSGDGPLAGNPDLLTIPGVGPRNSRKLVDKGIEAVADLKQLYRDKFYGTSSEKMVEFLQSSVGIIHKHHAESITTYIKDRVDDELKDSSSDGKPAPKKRLTFCVEGNISVGKSTFLQRIANETIELQDLVEIVPEPIDKWQDIGPDHFNILNAFYAEPQRYAYTFQNYVFVTRVMQERDSSSGLKPLRLMERSVFSDRMVFVRAVHEANWMNEMEISIYDSWFDPVVSCLPGLIPDAFIYLRASPDTCHKRMKLRRRTEEGAVSLEYLRDLHEKHESWLFPSDTGNNSILSVSKPPLMDNSVHPDIRDRVFYLEGNHMHSSIQKVPALVLDCEPNIDFNRDIEAKREYARQVAEFFEFVKKKNEADEALKVGQPKPHVVLPQQSPLWLPNGKPFTDSTLQSMDFRRAMSLMSGK